jgi:hypothetical protein
MSHRSLSAIRWAGRITLLFLCGAALAGETAEREHSHELALPAGGKLHVENLIGSMSVQGGGEPGRVSVEARIVADASSPEDAAALADSIEIATEPSGADLTVMVRFPVEANPAFRFPRSESGNVVSRWVTPLLKRGTVASEYQGQSVEIGNSKGAAQVAVHLTVRVPFDIEASFRQVVGSLDCARSRGTFDVDVTDGQVLIQQMNGVLTVRTGRADLAVKTFRGERLELQTGSGGIEVTDIHGKTARLRSASGLVRGALVNVGTLHVETGTGDVSLTDFEPESFDLSTSSGSVDVATRLRRATGGTVTSESGNVTLRLGGLTSFELTASAPSGSVKTKGLPLEVLAQDDGATRYKHRAGGRSLNVSTATGDVMVRAL